MADVAEECRRLEMPWLRKQGWLNGFRSGTVSWTRSSSDQKSSITLYISTLDEMYARLVYTVTDGWTGEKRDYDYKARLTTTRCNYGGVRYWFICPLTKNGAPCGRRVGVLYQSGDWFGCRRCHGIVYESQTQYWPAGGLGASMRFLDVEFKVERLEKDIKRRYYAGKPTRKQRQIDKLYRKRMPDAMEIMRGGLKDL